MLTTLVKIIRMNKKIKINVIVILFTIISKLTLCQTLPIKLIAPSDDYAFFIQPYDSGKYFTIKHSFYSDDADSLFIIAFNEEGSVLKNEALDLGSSDWDFRMRFCIADTFNNKFFLLGNAINTIDNHITDLARIVLDENLNLLSVQILESDSLAEDPSSFYRDEAHNFYISGYSTDDENIIHAFFYKLDSAFQFNNSINFDESSYITFYGIQELTETNQLTAFSLTNKMCFINKETFELDSIVSSPIESGLIRGVLHVEDANSYAYSMQYSNDTTLLYNFKLCFTDEDFSNPDCSYYSDSASLFPGMNVLSYADSNHIYCAYTSYQTIYFVSEHLEELNYIKILRSNSVNETQYVTNIGGDANYFAYATYPAKDGNVWLLSVRYDWNVQDHEYDIYIYKINAEGEIILSATEPEKDISQFQIYPNPASQNLNMFSLLKETGMFSIYDMSGNLVLEGTLLTGDNLINIKELSNGMYLFQMKNESETASKVFVKM